MNGDLGSTVGLVGGVVVIFAAVAGVVVFLFRTFKTKDDVATSPSDKDELVEELRDQLDDLRRELRNERQSRADDNDRSQRQIAELNRQVATLTTACEVLRDRLDNRPPYNGSNT